MWTAADRLGVTVRDLLSHSSGLPAYREFFRTRRGRLEFEAAICETRLEYQPRTASVYSDLGFILLGFIVAGEFDLPTRFDTLLRQMGIVEDLQFSPPAHWRRRTAPTERDPFREIGRAHV